MLSSSANPNGHRLVTAIGVGASPSADKGIAGCRGFRGVHMAHEQRYEHKRHRHSYH